MPQTNEAGTLPGVCKYVRFGDGFFLVFPMTTSNNEASHERIARAYRRSTPVSAASFVMVDGDVLIEGRSESLNLDPLPDDAEFLSKGLTT